MKILDLFCGAGGCSVGYHRAGFDVVGVDVRRQPKYPFAFHQADALSFVRKRGREFDAIHASPPCQAYTPLRAFHPDAEPPDLIDEVRQALQETGRSWVIENVMGAPLQSGAMLCGLMFGLKVFRHRRFEASFPLTAPLHPSHEGKRIGQDGMCCVVGKGMDGGKRHRVDVPKELRSLAACKAAMGIDWMGGRELSQAIPPAYTEWIGRQIAMRLRAIGAA